MNCVVRRTLTTKSERKFFNDDLHFFIAQVTVDDVFFAVRFHSIIKINARPDSRMKKKMYLSGNHTSCRDAARHVSTVNRNIAVDFKADMSFSAKDIETMLVENENDRSAFRRRIKTFQSAHTAG